MEHSISISVLNNPLGAPQSTDGIMMLVCQAVAVSGFTLEHAYLLTKLADLDALNIDAAYDTTNKVAVYQQVSEFYTTAGDGSLVWLIGTSKSTNSNAFAAYVATTGFKNLIRSTAQADPANRVKMIGLCYGIPAAFQTAADFPADVAATQTAMQATKDALFAEGFPFNFIVDGYNMSATVSAANIGTQATKSISSGSLCITGTTANGVSAVGMALGKFAIKTVGHALNNISDGATPASAAFLTNGTLDTIIAENTIVNGTLYYVSAGTVTYNGTDYDIGEQFTGGAVAFFTGTGTIKAVTSSKTTSGNIALAGIYLVKVDTITYNAVTYNVGDIFTGTATTTFTGSGEAYLLGLAILAEGAIVQNVVYLVSVDDVVYNGNTYSPGDTFTGLASPSIFTGLGSVNAQATAITDLYAADITAYGAKQYLFLRTWEGHSGYYWNDAATCCASNLPLSTQEFGRVANKLTSEVRAFMIETIGQNLPIDKLTGLVDKGYTNTKEQEFYNSYIVPLKPAGGTGDISDAQLTMVGTPSGTQITWNFVLIIIPTPIVGSIAGTIEFAYTL